MLTESRVRAAPASAVASPPTGPTHPASRESQPAAATTRHAGRPQSNVGARRDAPFHAAFLAQRRFASLNGLRCFAILEVIWYHATGHVIDPMARGLGVDLSFAISGFLITTLLAREFSKTGKIDVPRFYARRTLRIFPLYFTVLGLYVLLVLCTHRGTPEGTAFFHHLPAYATYTSNWFVPLRDAQSNIFYFAWSLATQEQFYLLWPLALLLCLTPGHWWRAGVVMAALLVIDEAAVHAISGHGFGITVMRSIGTPICLGALWALALQSPTGFAIARRALGHRATALALLAALAACIALLAPFEATESVLAALVAACCIREDNLAAPLLTAPPLLFVGQISYGMYLLHMLALNIARPIVGERSGTTVFLAGTAITIVLAHASYRWFETPILRYRDRESPRAPASVALS